MVSQTRNLEFHYYMLCYIHLGSICLMRNSSIALTSSSLCAPSSFLQLSSHFFLISGSRNSSFLVKYLSCCRQKYTIWTMKRHKIRQDQSVSSRNGNSMRRCKTAGASLLCMSSDSSRFLCRWGQAEAKTNLILSPPPTPPQAPLLPSLPLRAPSFYQSGRGSFFSVWKTRCMPYSHVPSLPLFLPLFHINFRRSLQSPDTPT